jgi:hypothetical protein
VIYLHFIHPKTEKIIPKSLFSSIKQKYFHKSITHLVFHSFYFLVALQGLEKCFKRGDSNSLSFCFISFYFPYLFSFLFVSLSTLSVCLSVYLSIYLSIYLSPSFSFFLKQLASIPRP